MPGLNLPEPLWLCPACGRRYVGGDPGSWPAIAGDPDCCARCGGPPAVYYPGRRKGVKATEGAGET